MEKRIYGHSEILRISSNSYQIYNLGLSVLNLSQKLLALIALSLRPSKRNKIKHVIVTKSKRYISSGLDDNISEISQIQLVNIVP